MRRCSPCAIRSGRAWTSSPTARRAARATRTASPRRSAASTSTTRARRSTAAATPTRCPASSARSSGCIRSRCAISHSYGQHEQTGQDHCAGPVHDVAAGAERLLRRRGRAGARLCRRRPRRDRRPVRRGRGHRPDRRAVHAGAAGEGARLRRRGTPAGARRHRGHDRRAHLLRLRRDHPRPPVRLLLPARARRRRLRPGLDRDGAVGHRHGGDRKAARQAHHPRRDRPRRHGRRVARDRRRPDPARVALQDCRGNWSRRRTAA